MDVLKIATAGSVDDGKSTLIGRLLYDTKSLTDDKLEAIAQNSKKKGYDYLDFSLATDGLVAEREQGITIDVAHIYFSTAKRSYIIADTPGHVEYTRNMVTGASTSQVAIVLIDARKGVIEQTKRHFFINNLLRIKDVIVAVNKMDLVDFDESNFTKIKLDMLSLQENAVYKDQKITFIPISALNGDNVVEKSENMLWYQGTSLLDHLENTSIEDVKDVTQTRFQVQTVIRPKKAEYHDFRGYAGKIKGGDFSVGDEIIVLPGNTSSTIKEIHFFDQTFEKAVNGTSVTLTLVDDIDVSRGDVIVKANELPRSEKNLTATVCWMDKTPLQAGKKYKVQHGVHKVVSKITAIKTLIQPEELGTKHDVAEALKMNDIGEITFKVNKELHFDNYAENKENGAFIFIDPQTNTTAGVGFIG
ncbi:MAG: GTP-binding protein [Crocinitomicaceae bacterium]|nr:GTP-binding protein [Crocinitomicaceae bacterium]